MAEKGGGVFALAQRRGNEKRPFHAKRPFSLSFTYGKIQFMMPFEIISKITDVETIAKGSGIDEIAELRATYGGYNWRKKKGIATVRFINGDIRVAEVHWYECHGIGRRKEKIKKVIRK